MGSGLHKHICVMFVPVLVHKYGMMMMVDSFDGDEMHLFFFVFGVIAQFGRLLHGTEEVQS